MMIIFYSSKRKKANDLVCIIILIDERSRKNLRSGTKVFDENKNENVNSIEKTMIKSFRDIILVVLIAEECFTDDFFCGH